MTSRTPLPARRAHTLIPAVHQPIGAHIGLGIEIGLGHYEDGRLGEIFLDPVNSDHAPLLRDAAVLASLALQHGADIATLREAITRDADGRSPCTMIGSVIDAVVAYEESRQ